MFCKPKTTIEKVKIMDDSSEDAAARIWSYKIGKICHLLQDLFHLSCLWLRPDNDKEEEEDKEEQEEEE